MKILYGVVGEGMGHAIRSRVVIDYLLGQGHAVEIMASSRACDFMTARYGAAGVQRIHGLHILYEENRVRRGKTLWSNVLTGLAGIPQNITAYFQLIEQFRPEVVISDFESWTYLYGQLHRLPILSIDNMQILNRCRLPDAITAGAEDDFQLARAFVKSKLPFCDHYLVTTFFRPELRRDRTALVPPILRPEILGTESVCGEHLLVYQTGEGYDTLADTLRQTGVECRIYGMRRAITEEQVEGNLRYRPFSEQTFVSDLAGCRGVIAGGGFTLMGEAVYLHKPMLSVPVRGQFEQILNGRYLEYVGYGLAAPSLDNPATVRRFLTQLPTYQANLARYAQDGNRELEQAVDTWLDRAAAGLL